MIKSFLIFILVFFIIKKYTNKKNNTFNIKSNKMNKNYKYRSKIVDVDYEEVK